MTLEIFLTLLGAFALLTGIVTEIIKKVAPSVKCYNTVALIVSVIIGAVGTIIFYQLSAIPFTTNNIIYSILLGLASGMVAMVGYDKVVQLVEQFAKLTKK